MEVEITPKLLEGTIKEVHEVGVMIQLKGRMGQVLLPLRAVITNKTLEVGDRVELYLSYAHVLEAEEQGT
jgi:hypothetical protein